MLFFRVFLFLEQACVHKRREVAAVLFVAFSVYLPEIGLSLEVNIGRAFGARRDVHVCLRQTSVPLFPGIGHSCAGRSIRIPEPCVNWCKLGDIQDF